MRCDDIRAKLIAFLHHELSLSDENSVQTHLAACIGCQQELDQARAVKRVLRGVAPVEPAAQMRRNLERRLRHAGYRDFSERAPLGADAPARPALPFEPPKRLPAPSVATETSTAPIPNVGAPSPSSRAVSERLDAGRHRHSRQLKVLFFACGFLLALSLIAALALSTRSNSPVAPATPVAIPPTGRTPERKTP